MNKYQYVVNVEGAVCSDGEYLLIERAQNEDHAAGLLGFPGGKLEAPPETAAAVEQTARRELREEVGIEIGDVSYVFSSTFEVDSGLMCLNIVTLCEWVDDDPVISEPDEVAAIHWLSPEEAKQRSNVPPYTLSYIQKIEEFRDSRDQ